jgi:uncharacterized protein (DUF697 family)
MEKRSLADTVIADHVAYAMGAALIPLPVVDVAAVTAVQVDMVRTLADSYSVGWDQNRAKAIVLSLVGASIARLGASAVKVVPGAGTVIGGATQVVLSGASTYAVGQLFCAHFGDRGTLADFDTEVFRDRYMELLEKGKQVAQALREKALGMDEPSVEELADTLERLGKLKAAGVISQEEFDRLKAPLIDSL